MSDVSPPYTGDLKNWLGTNLNKMFRADMPSDMRSHVSSDKMADNFSLNNLTVSSDDLDAAFEVKWKLGVDENYNISALFWTDSSGYQIELTLPSELGTLTPTTFSPAGTVTRAREGKGYLETNKVIVTVPNGGEESTTTTTVEKVYTLPLTWPKSGAKFKQIR